MKQEIYDINSSKNLFNNSPSFNLYFTEIFLTHLYNTVLALIMIIITFMKYITTLKLVITSNK